MNSHKKSQLQGTVISKIQKVSGREQNILPGNGKCREQRNHIITSARDD